MGKKRIGLYGGTFDPIHLGHVNFAQQILEIQKLDEIWFCPARISPHKQDMPVTDVQLRIKMVKKAIEHYSHFRLLDIESKRLGPSYTIDTLREIKKMHPEHQIFLLLGYDAVAHFDYWKEPEAIVQIATLLIGMRSCSASLDLPIGCSDSIKNEIKQGVTPIHVMEISSTDIRKRASQNKPIEHLVSHPVAELIKKYNIYSSSA